LPNSSVQTMYLISVFGVVCKKVFVFV
jgi:hypothetical protein